MKDGTKFGSLRCGSGKRGAGDRSSFPWRGMRGGRYIQERKGRLRTALFRGEKRNPENTEEPRIKRTRGGLVVGGKHRERSVMSQDGDGTESTFWFNGFPQKMFDLENLSQ